MDLEYVWGAFQVRPAERQVWQAGHAVPLGARAFDVLLALLERRGQVVSKGTLMGQAWPGLVVEEGNLAVQVSALRKLLGGEAITTVPGRGYQFTATVSERRPSTAGSTPAPAAPAPAAAPALATAPEAPGWVPAALTPILGRDAALAELQQRLRATRCLTLTGAGGSGKTRLALALASAVRTQHAGGVWWTGLDRLADGQLLAPTLAQALGAADPHRPALQRVVGHLKGRAALLVLDNCEHLVDDCAELVAQLLRELPQLQVLATSRESLRVPGEVVWTVPPLEVPSALAPEHWAHLMRHASVQLLVQRISQHQQAFTVTPDNAAALVQICRGLDGLPLALELVAAQVGPLSLEQVVARLDHSLPLLNVGSRGATPHHQTMAAAVEWGYRLLPELEARLFLRLSVFVGGWTLDSAAAVCQGLGMDSDELPALLGRLQRASMVLSHGCSGTVRFRMLEPIRQFALARLQAQGEADPVRAQWLAWAVAWSQALGAQLGGPQQAQGYQVLVAEFDNLRALLHWAQREDLANGLRLASNLWRFWQHKGHAKEMLGWLEASLACAGEVPKRVLAEATNTAGLLARTCGLYTDSVRWHSASLQLHVELGNRRGEAVARNNLCLVARDQSDHVRVEELGQANLAAAREIGDRNLEALALMHLGTALRGQDRLVEAEATFHQGWVIFNDLGEVLASAAMLNFLGNVALAAGRLAQARARFEEAMALNQTLDSPWGLAITHHNLAALHVALGNDGAALPALVQSLSMFQKAGVKHGVETCFETLAGVAQRQALLQRAAWCWGVVERLESDMGKRLELEQQARREAQLATLATLMGAEHLDQARQAGRSSPLDEAYRAVLAGSSQPAPAGASKAGL